ncbi:MAG: carbamoyltransferase N-terminal domain-containing protein [Xanthobacteraceae bacterium]
MAAPLILGINAYHADAAACIVRDGKLLAAAEEERFRRIKHWAGFPSQAIQYCLREANVELADVTHVAVNRNSRANLLRKLHYVAFHHPSVRLLLKRLRNRQQMASITDELRMLPGRPFAGKIEHVEHHLAHLSLPRPSKKPLSFRSMALATLPAQHGGAGRASHCHSMAVCCFRTRLASSIKR